MERKRELERKGDREGVSERQLLRYHQVQFPKRNQQESQVDLLSTLVAHHTYHYSAISEMA